MDRKEYIGLSVCPGAVVGRAHVLTRKDSDSRDIENDEILILDYSHPDYSTQMLNAAGVICENGGRLSHICTIAMEMGIPCITQVPNVTKEIKDNSYISLDATNGKAYVIEK